LKVEEAVCGAVAVVELRDAQHIVRELEAIREEQRYLGRLGAARL
jgi:hypothetical protein